MSAVGTILEISGNEILMNINGTRLIFHPTGQGVWVNNTAGELWIKQVGDLLALSANGSTVFAYPTNTNVWIISGSIPGPDPDPGTGDYSWPFEPTSGHWVTSEYGPRSGRFHEGIDFSGGPAVYGNPIPAIGDATVHQSGLNGAFGYSVILFHGSFDSRDWYSLYAHMPSTASQPSVGSSVDKGDTIGFVNNTGSSFGSHLHMEIHKVPVGGNLRWDNLNPSYTSSRTPINPRNFFTEYGDGTWIIS